MMSPTRVGYHSDVPRRGLVSKGPEVFDDSADSTYEWFCVLERFKMSRDIILFTTKSAFSYAGI
jgi:hypothetical protein